jgi:hypothetical protein
MHTPVYPPLPSMPPHRRYFIEHAIQRSAGMYEIFSNDIRGKEKFSESIYFND